MRTAGMLVVAFAVLALLSSAVLAGDTALLFTVSFLPDGSARFDDVQVTKAGVDGQPDTVLKDSVRLVIDGRLEHLASVPVTFRMLDAPKAMPAYTSTHRFPYRGNTGVLRVVRSNVSVAEFDLGQLCVQDGWCRGYENGLSCPEDCDIRYADGVCLPYNDGGCDPDCREGLDPDCARAPAAPAEARWIPVALLVIVLAGIATFLWWQRQ